MGCCGSTPTVPSSPPPLPAQAGETVQSTHQTSVPSSTTSIPLPKPGATTPTHDRFSDFASSQRPHHSEMRFQPSGGSGSLPRSRFMSDASHALPQGALSHSSRPRTASASASAPMHSSGIRVGSRPLAEGQEGRPRFPSTLKSSLPNDFRYVDSRCPISHYYHSSFHRFRILVVGKVCVIQSDMPWTQLMHVSSQRESGKSSLINAVFKVNMSVCTQSSLHSCLTNLCALQIIRERQLMYLEELPSFFHATTVNLLFMNVRDLDPEICKPSEIPSRPATRRAAQHRKDYTPFGKETILYVAIKLYG